MGTLTTGARRLFKTVGSGLCACLLATTSLPLCDMAYAREADDFVAALLEGTEYVEDEILVVMEEGVSADQGARSISIFALDDEEAADAAQEAAGQDVPVVVQLDEDTTVAEALEEAIADPNIKLAQPNYVYHLLDNERVEQVVDEGADGALLPRIVPDDPAVSSLTPSSSAANAWHLDSINAFEAWDIATCDDAVTVAVLDTGCRLDHEDLKDQVWQEYAWNAYLSGKLTGDYNGHGTHVCGLAAARANNGIGIAGSSYNARVLPVCVFDTTGESCYTSTLVEAYQYILEVDEKDPELNLHVVNMSLGGYGSTGADDDMLRAEISKARERGIVTICAGGNGDKYGNPYTINSWPSDYPEVVAVTALDTTGNTPSTWCDYNDDKDICAPGVSLYSTYLESTSSYTVMSGTSMASPITAGAFALLWKAVPSLTVDEALDAVYSTAGELVVPAGREGKYGAGTLDIEAAVKSLSGVYITTKDARVASGNDLGLECFVAGERTGNEQVTWTVNNGTGTATIDAATGVLRGLLPGEVTVTATCTANGVELGSDSCIVTICPLELAQAPQARTVRDAVKISWDEVPGAVGYVVSRSASADGTFETIADTASLAMVDNSPSVGTASFYRVAPYSLADHKDDTGLPSSEIMGMAAPLVSAYGSNAAGMYEFLDTLLLSNASTVHSVVLARADDACMLVEAVSVAGVTGGVVVPVAEGAASASTSALAQDEVDILAAIDADEVIVMGDAEAVSDAYVAAVTQVTGGQVTRLGVGASSLSEAATQVVSEYADAWSSTALLVEPSMAPQACEIASYLYGMGVSVLFTDDGGASLSGSALVAAKRFESVLVFGDTTSIPRKLDAMLAVQGVKAQRWEPQDDTSVEAVGRAVEAGALTWDFCALYEQGDAASAVATASLMGRIGGVALPLGAQGDTAGSLEALRDNGDSVVAACITCAADAADRARQRVAMAIEGTVVEECDFALDVDTAGVLVGATSSIGVAYTGDGSVSVKSSDASVARVTYDAAAGVLLVSGVAPGFATVTLEATGGAAAYDPAPITLRVAVAEIDFMGGSLRRDGDDHETASLRMGYTLSLPSDTMVRDALAWKWEYGINADDLALTKVGEFYRTGESAGEMITNLVFTDIDILSFDTMLYAKLSMEFTDEAGNVYLFVDDVRGRSVKHVAGDIVSSSQSSSEDKAFAQGVMDALAALTTHAQG